MNFRTLTAGHPVNATTEQLVSEASFAELLQELKRPAALALGVSLGVIAWSNFPALMSAVLVVAIVAALAAGITYLANRYLAPSDETLAAMAVPARVQRDAIRNPWNH